MQHLVVHVMLVIARLLQVYLQRQTRVTRARTALLMQHHRLASLVLRVITVLQARATMQRHHARQVLTAQVVLRH